VPNKKKKLDRILTRVIPGARPAGGFQPPNFVPVKIVRIKTGLTGFLVLKSLILSILKNPVNPVYFVRKRIILYP
jgi:hypothetical protein